MFLQQHKLRSTAYYFLCKEINFFEGKSYCQTTATGLLQNTGTDNVTPVISLSFPDITTGIIDNKLNARQ